MIFVKKNPSAQTLLARTNAPQPGYEASTEEAADAWVAAQLAAGWVAEPLPAPTRSDAEIWADFLAGYITDPVTSIQLKANRSAKADFADMFTLMTAAIARGVITEATNQSIWDASEVEHVLPAGDILDLILRYGFAWQANFNALAP